MKSFKAFFLESLDENLFGDGKKIELDESQKEYFTVHRAASLTSARMKVAAPGDQPTYHRSEKEAIDHLNKKFKKVKDGVWQNNKDQFFFHKKNSPMKEEAEQIDEGVRLNPNFIGTKFSVHHEKTKNTAGEFKKVASASRHGVDYDIHKRYMGSNKTFHYIVVDKDQDKVVSQSTGFDTALKKANLNPVHAVKEETDLDETKKPKPGHNASVMSKNISKILSAIKNK